MFKKLIDKSAAKSPWLFHINTGSCNGCDIEIVACLTPRYDAERFGFKLAGSPRHADILIVSGPITVQSRDREQPLQELFLPAVSFCFWMSRFQLLII